MPKCCALLSDGVTRCSRKVAQEGDLCWQHSKLHRPCSFKPSEKTIADATEDELVAVLRKKHEAFSLTPVAIPGGEAYKAPGVVVPTNARLVSSYGACGSRLGLCMWPPNLSFGGDRHSASIDADTLYAELFNHASVHGGQEVAQRVQNEDPVTICDVLTNTVWPSATWINAQYKYINDNANVGVGSIWEQAANKRGWRPVKLLEYIKNLIMDRDSVSQKNTDNQMSPDPTMPKLNAILRQGVRADRPYYIWRGVHANGDMEDWFAALQTQPYLTMQPDWLNSTSISSDVAINFALGGSFTIDEFDATIKHGACLRIMVPAGVAGPLPIGRFDVEGAENEVCIPSDAKIRILPSTIKRTMVIHNLGEKEQRQYGHCDTIEMTTMEAVYEG